MATETAAVSVKEEEPVPEPVQTLNKAQDDNANTKSAEAAPAVVEPVVEAKTEAVSEEAVEPKEEVVSVTAEENVAENGEDAKEEQKEPEEKAAEPEQEPKKKVEIDPNDFTFKDWPECDFFKVSVIEVNKDILRSFIYIDEEKGTARINMTQLECLKNAHFSQKTDRCGTRITTWKTEDLPERLSTKLAIPEIWNENQNLLITDYNPAHKEQYETYVATTVAERKKQCEERKARKLRGIAIANGEDPGPAGENHRKKTPRNRERGGQPRNNNGVGGGGGGAANGANRQGNKGSAGRPLNNTTNNTAAATIAPAAVGNKKSPFKRPPQQQQGGGGGGGGGGAPGAQPGRGRPAQVAPFDRPPSLFAANIQPPTGALNSHAFGGSGGGNRGNFPAKNGGGGGIIGKKRKNQQQQPVSSNNKRNRNDPYDQTPFGYDNFNRRAAEPFVQPRGPPPQQQGSFYPPVNPYEQHHQQPFSGGAPPQRWASMPSGLNTAPPRYASFPTPVPPPQNAYNQQGDYGRHMGYPSRY